MSNKIIVSGEKTGKFAVSGRKNEIRPEIHTGFQQPVENLFENFPPFEQEITGYPKRFENSCGKRDSGVGKPGGEAKKQPVRRQTHIFERFLCSKIYKLK